MLHQFLPIDLVMLSHDHYDHLDYDSIQRLKSKVKKYFVALGVGRHLEKWGIAKKDITEFDWWDEAFYDDIKINFTPTRHFSGRGITDRAKSIWSGWTFKTETENIWFSGDSGYGDHFKEIGKYLDPFDFAFMECGQYNENWHQIHMYPEESIQASIDAKVKNRMPVHWSGFALSQHSWTDPVERFSQKATEEKLKYCVPKLGEIRLIDMTDYEKWW
ncbi:MBL fold metallo-hydrolase [Flavobacterium jejuense]|uniref:MBL fold metallo-hydrolase n=1 Tax=Flavobacterium jejuense TaxID=1544455 RepID=UPI00293BD25F|nr:MBL fold metallo-hydrolase [Flavobacterium jejuense]